MSTYTVYGETYVRPMTAEKPLDPPEFDWNDLEDEDEAEPTHAESFLSDDPEGIYPPVIGDLESVRAYAVRLAGEGFIAERWSEDGRVFIFDDGTEVAESELCPF